MGGISPKIWCHQKPEVTSSKLILPRIPSCWVPLDSSQRVDSKNLFGYTFYKSLFILLRLDKKLIELLNTFSKARMLAFVLVLCGRNWRTRRKPPTLDGQPLLCHMPTLVFELGAAAVTSEGFTPALSI